MSDHSYKINLRSETLAVLSTAYEGYAKVMEETGQWHIAASCYTIAGIYKVVFDQRPALSLFQQAAGAYRRAGHSYWKLLAVCGLDRNNISQGEGFTPGNNPQELYYELIRQYYLYSRGGDNSLEQLLEYISSLPIFLALPVGRSGVSLQIYVSIVRMSIQASTYDRETASLITNLQTLFEKNEEQFRLVHAHRIHWDNQISLIPFEPDFLAMLLCLQIQLNRAGVYINFKERMDNRESPMMAVMDIAEEMVEERRPPLRDRYEEPLVR